MGMAVSRQIDKRAVERNRIKRVIRESFRENIYSKNATPEYDLVINSDQDYKHTFVDVVVLPRRACATICNKQLFQSLEKHWSRITEDVENSGKAVNSDPG